MTPPKTEMRELIATHLKHNPAVSDRALSRELGSNHKLVAVVRQELESRGDILPQENRLDPRSGKLSQPATKTAVSQAAIVAATALNPLWATDNEWEIPLLDVGMQARVIDLPATCWGQRRRGQRLEDGGTYHFYTDDYRFTALLKDPSPVVRSGCSVVVEPNFSCTEQMPKAVALYWIYEKRRLARLWQEQGLPVVVDLNVARRFYQLNLLGVPAGWRAYATRAYSDRLGDLIDEFRLACDRRGSKDVLFLVVGGGEGAQALCREYGWPWVNGRNV